MKATFLFFSVCLFGLLASLPALGNGASKKHPMPGNGVYKSAPAKKPAKILPPPHSKANPKNLSPRVLHVQSASANWNMSSGQKAALDKLLAQQPLTQDDRQQLSDLLFNGQQAGLTTEDESSLSHLLLDEAARNASAVSTAAPTPSEDKTGPLFLRVYNKTGERLKVWIQVLPDAQAKKNDAPTKDGNAAVPKLETLVYLLEPGKAYDLQHKGQRVQAQAIRVWAISSTRSWAEHRDQELFLTSPASKSKTYTLTFSK